MRADREIAMEEEMKSGEPRGKVSRNIKNLFLDPNNYRFVDNVNYKKISNSELIDEKVQQRTRKFIEGVKRENIKDLIESFKANGYLKVDVIQLRDLGDNHFLVIEGNRRVTALKCLQEDYKNGLSIGKLDPQIFASVPAEINEDNEELSHLIIMGLKHISGNKKWAAINQAQLIYDYLLKYWNDKEKYQEKEAELCNSLGITKNKIRTTQRAYHLITAYKKSDYGDQFTSDMYSIFEEAVKRPVIREWLHWDEKTYTAQNKVNEERFFSWISKTEILTEDEESEIRDPIITKAFEIRDLAAAITNENFLLSMEKWHSISKAILENAPDNSRVSIDMALASVADNIRTVKRYADTLETEDIVQLETAQLELEQIIPRKTISDLSNSGASECFSVGKVTHFTTIQLETYKKLSGLKIDNLRRINLFAGLNNSGKTTILEAVYLLCHQNDISALIDLAKTRNRIEGVTPQYLSVLLDDSIHINGIFNDCAVSTDIVKYQDYQVEKFDDYLTSVQATGEIDDQSVQMKLHLYGRNSLNREYKVIRHICRAIYNSPYYYQPEAIYQLYGKAIETKSNGKMIFERVLEFVKKMDPSIKNIFLVEENGQKSFKVDSDRYADKNVELSSYGEGLIRVFELALCVSNCKNGVVLIDEFETAIHYSMLVEFTRFIQELADEFNVQLFITTHSKECVDAFVKNQYKNDEISAYLVNSESQESLIKYITGENLEYLVDSISFDLRG